MTWFLLRAGWLDALFSGLKPPYAAHDQTCLPSKQVFKLGFCNILLSLSDVLWHAPLLTEPGCRPFIWHLIVQHITAAGCDSTLVSYDPLVIYIYLWGQNSEIHMTLYSSGLQSICKLETQGGCVRLAFIEPHSLLIDIRFYLVWCTKKRRKLNNKVWSIVSNDFCLKKSI